MNDQTVEVPQWLATLVGRLVIENEMLRHLADLAQQPRPQPVQNGSIPDEVPVP